MKKIILVKVKGVVFDAISVPVNVCGEEKRLIVPFICAPKQIKDENGVLCRINYTRGLTSFEEDLIINYYNKRIVRKALLLVLKTREDKLEKIFVKHKRHFTAWEHGFLQELGLQPVYYYTERIDKILNNVIESVNFDAITKWCVGYVDNYFNTKTVQTKYEGFSIEEAAIMSQLSCLNDDELQSLINGALNLKKWETLFYKLIIIPYIKEEREKEKEREKELTEAKREVAEIEAKLKLAKEKLNALM
jgi:hypothetical protein